MFLVLIASRRAPLDNRHFIKCHTLEEAKQVAVNFASDSQIEILQIDNPNIVWTT